MDVKVEVQRKGISLDRFAKVFPKATASALNKMAAQARTRVGDLVTMRYNINPADAKAAIYIKPASPQTLEAQLRAKKGRKAFGIIKFNPIETATGVAFVITRGTQKQLTGRVGTVGMPGTGFFMATMPSGHKGVFERTGAKVRPGRGRYAGFGNRKTFKMQGAAVLRQPIKELFTVGIMQMVKSPGVLKQTQTFIEGKLPAIVLHEMKFFGR